MASKISISSKLVAHFGTCDPVEARRLFDDVRGVMAARKLLGRGAKVAPSKAKPAKVAAVAPAQAASGSAEV